MWTISKDSAWVEINSKSYRHYSGASVEKSGRFWTAKTVDGQLIQGNTSAAEAVLSLRKLDHRFYWMFGHLGPHFGTIKYGDVYHRFRPVWSDTDEIFVFCVSDKGVFPEFLKSALSSYFLGVATCVRCSRPMSTLQMHKHSQFDGLCDEQNLYLSCNCGHPVWQMEMKLYSAALSAIRDAMRVPRAQRLKAAGGKHSREEMQVILALQANRCIYCNARFTDKCLPSKDHLLPVSCGGSDWALNIVMACKWCNASRGNIPFRTFCKLLTPKQNEKILMQLRKRLFALDFDHVADEAFRCFVQGLALHDPKDLRYLDIQSMRSAARRNVKANRLLPRTVASLLKRASILEETF